MYNNFKVATFTNVTPGDLVTTLCPCLMLLYFYNIGLRWRLQIAVLIHFTQACSAVVTFRKIILRYSLEQYMYVDRKGLDEICNKGVQQRMIKW